MASVEPAMPHSALGKSPRFNEAEAFVASVAGSAEIGEAIEAAMLQ